LCGSEISLSLTNLVMSDEGLGFEGLKTLKVRPCIGGLGLKFSHGRLLGLDVVLCLINLCLSTPDHRHLTSDRKFGEAKIGLRGHQFSLIEAGINGIQKITPMDVLIILDRQRSDPSGDVLDNDIDRIGSHHGIVGSGMNAI
jgi:hypothetical protein